MTASKGWSKLPLSKCASFINGRAFKPTDFGDSGLPVIRIKQLLDPSAACDLFSGDVEEKHRLRDGDLIFSWSGTLAVSRWWRGDAVLNQHLFRVIENRGIDRAWLGYALEASLNALSSKTHGTTMKHITKKTLDEHEIAIPPVVEQRRIADLAAAIDDAKRRTQEARKTAEALLDAQRESFFGELDATVALGEVLVSIGVGHSPRCLDRPPLSGELGVLKVSAVRPCRFVPTESKALPTGVEPKESARFQAGDLLITRSNTLDRVGAACVVRGDVANLLLSDLVFRVRLQDDLLAEFAAQALATRSLRQQIETQAVGTSGSMKKVNQQILRSLMLPMPDLATQERVLSVLHSIAEVIAAHEAQEASLAELGAAVLPALMTGEISLDDAYDRFLGASENAPADEPDLVSA